MHHSKTFYCLFQLHVLSLNILKLLGYAPECMATKHYDAGHSQRSGLHAGITQKLHSWHDMAREALQITGCANTMTHQKLSHDPQFEN